MNRILIIEGTESLPELEKDYLELSGFQVEQISRRRIGLEKALIEDYELVIIELIVPATEGFKICKAIRAEKNIPIVLVSIESDVIYKIQGLELGADDYVTRPYHFSELVARIKAHIARYHRLTQLQNHEKLMLDVSEVKVNIITRQVWVKGQEIIFTPKEYALLLFLICHPNQVFSKKELFQEVWNRNYIGNITSVSIYIKKLRYKIEEDITNPKHIETIWGVGYRFKL